MYFCGKIRNTRIFVMNQIRRHLFTSSVENNISKQSKFMQKLLNQSNRNAVDNLNVFGRTKREPSGHVTRRMNVLNKVFMEHITDFMATGELDHILGNKSIEIIDLKVTQDFKMLNIFWANKVTDTFDMEEILRRCAFELKHKLSQLQVVGKVPTIQFVKCKHIDQLMEVERRLAIADYGEDYVPSLYPFITNHVVTFKRVTSSERVVTSSVSNAKDEKVTQNENSDNQDDTFSITLPIMKHDVFGLDHSRIMSKIKVSMDSSKQSLKQQATNTQTNCTRPSNSDVQNNTNFLTDKEEEKQFSIYLKNIEKERRCRQRKKKNISEKGIYALYRYDDDDEDIDDGIDYEEYESDEDFECDENGEYIKKR